ncbi:SDR family oxidoreductase [Streptomyces xiamenensis]|uniref:Short-chain dehydrogenase/reductase SDR n=1 Tax=Streptomyces xiamenensis TaxID=408015 RepID=A0A0F7CPD5_9ACTN|nr:MULTISPECIES: SDR family oxidoreductase [Streptomyces]AKG44471.1 short-chain dehydrogenase/reductase SDR [Streptomyces xiamenensis]
MDLGLADRVYVVTGGSKGLGHATAAALVADGAKVVLASRDAANVEAAVERLSAPMGAPPAEGWGSVTGVAADLADPEAAERLARTALERYGRLDGALISVGGPPPGTAASATDEQWRAAFESVFLGSVRAVRTLAGRLTGDGAIGMVLSTSVRQPVGGLGISNGLRPGLAMVAKDMADEFGPRGVRVLGLLPGRIATDRMTQLDAAFPDARAAAVAGIPLGRYGEPAEFGRAAAFLLSPAASYITGSVIAVDGGSLRAI